MSIEQTVVLESILSPAEGIRLTIGPDNVSRELYNPRKGWVETISLRRPISPKCLGFLTHRMLRSHQKEATRLLSQTVTELS